VEVFLKHARVNPVRALAIAAFALFALAGAAAAGPVTIAPATFSPELEAKLAEDYGEREGAYLQARLQIRIERALARVGATVAPGAPIRIETTIISATPNKPTFEQLVRRPGLDYFHSISLGGAEVVGVLRGPDGAALGEVRHRYYGYDIRYNYANTTWYDADRAFTGFARKLANEYVRVAN
jgi:hypothetical protein